MTIVRSRRSHSGLTTGCSGRARLWNPDAPAAEPER